MNIVQQRVIILCLYVLRACAHSVDARPHLTGLPAPVPRGAHHKAAAAGLHDPHPHLDVYAIVQVAAVGLPPHRNALLHLRHHRHAGTVPYKHLSE